jgi:chemotaxis protein histidine kinase CheA
MGTEQTPAASTEQTPATSTEKTPAASAEQTPTTSTEQAPAASAEQTPTTSTEQAPAASTEQTPAASTEQTPAASTEQTPAASTEQTPAANDTAVQNSGDRSTSEDPNGYHDWEKEVAEAAKKQAADGSSESGQQVQSPAPAVTEEAQHRGDYEGAAADSRYGEAVSPSVAEQGNVDSGATMNHQYQGEPGEMPVGGRPGLFAQRPSELLLSSDQQLLRTLEALGEEAGDSRRNTVSDYLHGLGGEAVEFSSRFENATGVECASLADDLPGLAAFLASFRLVQQGKMSVDEAIQTLQQGLENRVQSWADAVRDLTTAATDESGNSTGNSQPRQEDSTSAGPPVVDTVARAAVQTLSDFGAAVWSLSCQIAARDWQSSF